MRALVLSMGLFAASIVPASAGFLAWDAEIEEDPFSGGKRVTAGYMSSIRSGVIIICDTAEKGLTLRAIPGFAFDDVLSGETPEIEVAIDGNRLLGQEGQTGSVGDNLAIAEVLLTPENSRAFVKAFAEAKKQIAVKDGISDRPHLMTARGSTKTGAALVKCMDGQAD